jgi:hypothetical protein
VNWRDLLLYGPGWLASGLIILGRWLDHRFRRRYRETWGVDYDGP